MKWVSLLATVVVLGACQTDDIALRAGRHECERPALQRRLGTLEEL
jgi:hypothetical protein